jgi:hypothetical protein
MLSEGFKVWADVFMKFSAQMPLEYGSRIALTL